MRVDWPLAGRIARAAAGDAVSLVAPVRLDEIAEAARDQVIAVTGLQPQGPLPPVEWVGRDAWIDANLTTMSAMIAPLLEDTKAPGGLFALEATAGALAAAEIGGVMGMFSRRVLGQLELNLMDPSQPPRLLLVGPNLDRAARVMGVDRSELVTWVTLHEITHAVQFGAVPWLRESLGGAMGELIGGLAGGGSDLKALLRLSLDDVREIVGAVREGGLMGAVIGPERRALMHKVQGTMGLVEGHAEWAMDHAGHGVLADVDGLRAAMDARRDDRAPLLRILDRVLGMDLKLRQYTEGRVFCDAIVEARGRDGLRAAWAAAELAPSPAELAEPPLWLARTAGAPGAAAA